MRIVIVVTLSLLTFGCRDVSQPVTSLNSDLNLSAPELSKLELESANGNAASAWRVYLYYSLALENQTAAELWLKRAAELQNAQAQRLLAYLIKENNASPSGFGTNGPEAVKVLLECSSRTEGNACFDLASAYAEGYFGAADYAKARECFERGASFGDRMCWTELSRYYRQGIGGPRNDTESYYWISLEARCVDPRSIGGQATWTTRDEIAKRLTIAELQKEWTRIDEYICKVDAGKTKVYPPPFLSGMIDSKLEAEGQKVSMEAEIKHRKKWMQEKD
jgi:hypothetical protein